MALPTIGCDELRRKLESGEPLVVVDALPPMSYAHSHLPGGINLPPHYPGGKDEWRSLGLPLERAGAPLIG